MFKRIALLSLPILCLPSVAFAAGGADAGHGNVSLVLLFIAAMVLAAYAGGALIERFGQPSVLGELLVGVLFGALAMIPGLGVIETLKQEAFIRIFAEIGVILLLFRAGLESNIAEMAKVGARALAVACVGVVVPFVAGYFVSQALLPDASTNVYLFIGATLTATSVGITTRVFKDLNVLKSPEAKIVLGAAVIDDVLGLMILAVVSTIIKTGALDPWTIVTISAKALLFLSGAVLIGQAAAPRLGRIFSRIHGGQNMKMAIALFFGFFFAFVADQMGLAMIVGAFAAGLVLDAVHFKPFQPPEISDRLRQWAETHPDEAACIEMVERAKHEEHAHVEQLIDGISRLFMPVFFVYTGLQVNLAVFGNAKVVGIALVLTAVAILGKLVSGLAVEKRMNRLLVGVGMVPRGEVGLIFAGIGRALGVVDDTLFAAIVIVVILTTLVTPPLLNAVSRRTAAGA